MLSRVAAVKVPRTHNRRRVTGSSGRRREGRESEPQRPNMSRRVFTSAVLLLFVMMMCCGSGAAAAEQAGAAVDPFKGTTPISFANWKEFKDAGREITSLRVPGLVKVGDDVFAVAEAQCGERNGAGSCAGIVSKHLNISDDSMDISTSDISLFCMQLVDTAANNFGTTELLRPTTLVIGESVYMLLGNYSRKKQQIQGTNEPGLLLVKGTVAEENGKKKIRWNETHVMNPQAIRYSGFLTELIGGGGSGAVMGDGALVFPMQAKGKDGTRVLLSMRLPKSENKWQLSYETPGKGCRDPTMVKWEKYEYGEELFMMAHCAGGYYDVYRSISDGVNWYPSGQPITRVWGNSHNRTGYGVQSGSTTAIIEEKEVMLVTAPVYAKEDNGKGRLHLWVTDKARVYDVGQVSREDDDAAASSLLMKEKNKELISLYENKKDGSYSLVAVRLTEKLERVKEVVKKWKDLDGALQSCSFVSSSTVDAHKKGMCNGRVPTDGLVGFLSGNFSDNTWRDEYLGVDAIVHGSAGKRIEGPNGLTFKVSGAWAEWPVGDMGQTVPYYFANNKFTLVATVSIHEVPKEDSSPVPLMGVRMNDTSSTVLFGLSYTHDRKWLAIAGNRGDAEYFDYWEPNKTYQVGLRMDDDDEWTVFVDGKQIDHKSYDKSLFDSHRISHFYIGGDSKHQSATGGHVTVTNVMLYNEKLFGSELDELHASKVNIPSLGAEKQPTEQAANTGALVASESKSEGSATSHEELNEDDTEKQEEESADGVVLAPLLSTFAGGSSVSEPATATEIAGNSRPEDNVQLSEDKTSQQTTPHEAKESMQRDSDVQPQDPQSEVLTEVADVEGSAESYDTQQPEEDEEADGRSGGSVSPVAVSLSMDTATAPVYGEHQVQQSTEPSTENDDVRSTGTGTTGAEESLSLEAGGRNSEGTMSSDSSLTPSKSDAEPRSAEDTDNISWTEGAEFSVEDGKEVPQTVDTAPGNTSTTPGETKIPSESNATTPSDTDILLEKGHLGELAAMYLIGDSTVHGYVSRVLLLLLLGLWGIAALC
ncbi:trans-sialidase, putative [Trypanosoma cruzi]|uniref:Trans-sialidase, putative n=1 Tax=Trypanosoma cruzi (strain CL Brener) TaxID=353153 RepID=Q4DBF1_TRYCC|nr:trans-sialidase, putative [Trypanosoma cruzi]EAN89852.1 trans-sialidase, putative [Trypanosoma cruzi]|eukprot:XP_811703.1 trans-sialidase [Trypanosoma cruzi strain CL Brener]